MIWAALFVGILLGIGFVLALDWIAVDPAQRQTLEAENAQLRKEVRDLTQLVDVMGGLAISCPECCAYFPLSAGKAEQRD